MTATTLLISLAVQVVSVLTQPSPPAQGIQLGAGPDSAIFPLNVSQCEPVLIFYSISLTSRDLEILTPDGQVLVNFPIFGTSYLEWICDIPTGDGFIASGLSQKYYVVQPGSSSSCLRNLTSTFAAASYNTPVFQSYTQLPSNTASLSLDETLQASMTVTYPSGSFSTITVNPELAITSSSSATSSSQPGTSALPLSSSVKPSHPVSKSKAAAIAGGIAGAMATALLTFAIILYYIRKHRKSVSKDPTVTPMVGFMSQPDVKFPMAENPPSASQDAAGTSSTQITPFLTPRTGAAASSKQAGTPQTPESQDPQLNPVAKSDTPLALQSIPGQQGVSIGSTTDSTSSSVTVHPGMSHAQPMSTSGNESQNDPPNVMTALNMLSQLDPTQRQTVFTMLHSAVTSDDSSGENIVSAPPPYDG